MHARRRSNVSSRVGSEVRMATGRVYGSAATLDSILMRGSNRPVSASRTFLVGVVALGLLSVVGATIGTAPAAGKTQLSAADTPYLVFDRFDAAYDGNVSTNYQVTASSWANLSISVTWTMQ